MRLWCRRRGRRGGVRRPDRPEHLHRLDRRRRPGRRRRDRLRRSRPRRPRPPLGRPAAGERRRGCGELGRLLDRRRGDRGPTRSGDEPVTFEVVGLADDAQIQVTATLFTPWAGYEEAVLSANPGAGRPSQRHRRAARGRGCPPRPSRSGSTRP